MLDHFPSEIMRLLIQAEEPLSVEDLKARLRLQDDDGDGEQWSTTIEGVLREFQRLGLAEPQSG